MNDTRAYILAGGKSSRFGSDKARAMLGGSTLIERIASSLRDAGLKEITVVAECADKYRDLNLRTIGDRLPGRGPLGGIETALHDSLEHVSSWIFLTSCDVIEINRHWIEQLSRERTKQVEFVAYRKTHWEPLFACYHVSLLERIEQQFRNEQTAVWKLLDSSRGIALNVPEDWPKRVQANTRDELNQAQVQGILRGAAQDS